VFGEVVGEGGIDHGLGCSFRINGRGRNPYGLRAGMTCD
jgi:hypothetical protein